MGRALRDGYRSKVFLMTKIDSRTRQAARKQIDQCLHSLQTDVIDLVQIHEVIRMTDPARVFGPDGKSAPDGEPSPPISVSEKGDLDRGRRCLSKLVDTRAQHEHNKTYHKRGRQGWNLGPLRVIWRKSPMRWRSQWWGCLSELP